MSSVLLHMPWSLINVSRYSHPETITNLPGLKPTPSFLTTLPPSLSIKESKTPPKDVSPPKDVFFPPYVAPLKNELSSRKADQYGQ